MFIYLIIIFILALFTIGYVKDKNNSALYILMFCVLWGLASFRGISVGNDTQSYYRLFERIATTGDYANMTWRYEIGYLWINKLLTAFVKDFNLYLAIINAFIYYVYYKFIKRYSENKIFSVFLFFTLGIWGQTVNIIRLEIAIALSMVGYMLIDGNKKKSAFVVSLSSVLFQRISLLFLIGLFVPKKVKRKFYYFSSVIAGFAFLCLPVIVERMGGYSSYFSQYYLNSSSNYILGEIKLASILNMLLALGVFILGIFALRNKSIENDPRFVQQVNMVFIAFLILFASLRFNILDRCSYFFWVFSIVMIPNAVNRMKSGSNSLLLKFSIIIIGIAYFLVITIMKPEWNSLYPYVSCFSN